MRLGDFVRKHQVWFIAVLAAAVVMVTTMLSVPANTEASRELTTSTSGVSGSVGAAISLPVGGLAILVLMIGLRALRAVRR